MVDHSKMDQRDRTASHTRFRGGGADCLVVVRAADEGLDVPDADQALITSGTLNPRQRIQRFGRVVRLGGQQPRALSLLAQERPRRPSLLGATWNCSASPACARFRPRAALPPLWGD